MISLAEFRERWAWFRTIYSVYPTWTKFSAELQREKDASYRAGYQDGCQAMMQEMEQRMAGMSKAAKN